MKIVGIVLVCVVILVLILIMFYMGRLIYLGRKIGNADEVRAARRKNVENVSERTKEDRKRVEDIVEQEKTRAAQIDGISIDNVTEFALDWSYRKAADGYGLDGVHDNTGVNWIVLQAGGDLARAVEQYVKVKLYISETGPSYRVREAIMWRKDTTHLRISSVDEIDSLKGIKEDVFDMCREHNIRIIIERGKNIYYDFVSQCEYKVVVGDTWPGSADDAATYGMLELVKKI